MKLTKDELNQLKAKHKVLNDALVHADALNLYTRMFTNNLLSKKGLDMSKNYNVSLQSGKVAEVKPPVAPKPEPKKEVKN